MKTLDNQERTVLDQIFDGSKQAHNIELIKERASKFGFKVTEKKGQPMTLELPSKYDEYGIFFKVELILNLELYFIYTGYGRAGNTFISVDSLFKRVCESLIETIENHKKETVL